jgi:steroid delta-isomerase-like uncharacterized protein
MDATDTRADDNVRQHRETLQAFNRRDLDGVVRYYADDFTTTDHGQQATMKSTDAVRSWNQGWIDAFPDAELEILSCIGAGDWTVARFAARGTNDGWLGALEPTNRRTQLDICQLARWQDGAIVEEHVYYDMYGFLAQLGHVPPLDATG